MQNIIYGFSQQAACELGLDIVDIVLLRWFVKFKESGNMVTREFDGEVYYWVNYKRVSENFPILNLKKNAIYRHFKKMADKNVLKRKTLKVAGTYSFYALDKMYDSLVVDDCNTVKDYCDDKTLKEYNMAIYQKGFGDGKIENMYNQINNGYGQNVIGFDGSYPRCEINRDFNMDRRREEIELYRAIERLGGKW